MNRNPSEQEPKQKNAVPPTRTAPPSEGESVSRNADKKHEGPSKSSGRAVHTEEGTLEEVPEEQAP